MAALVQRKVVARGRDHQWLSRAQGVMNITGATARLRLAGDAEQIAIPFGRAAGQGVLTDQPAGKMEIDMGAGRLRRQRLPLGAHQTNGQVFRALAPQAIDHHREYVAHMTSTHTRKKSPKPIFFSPRR